MLLHFVQDDRLPLRLRIQPGEVGNGLRFLRIHMEWDAIAFFTLHVQRQAQLFELFWLLKVPVGGRKEQSRYAKPSIQFEYAE